MKLFCLPHAGGAANAFVAWGDRLDLPVEISAIQPPGRWDRWTEPPFTRVQPLAQAVAKAITPLITGPYVLFGHSLGAVVAFEVARALRHTGAPAPLHLVASARKAPQQAINMPSLCHLPDHAFIAEMARRYGAIPQAVLADPELLQAVLPALRADMEAYETYTYKPAPPLDCPITAFGGDDDAIASAEDLSAWREQTTAAFSTHLFDGGHFYFESDHSFFSVLSALLADSVQSAGGLV